MGKKKCPDGVELIEGPKGGIYYLRNGKKVYCEGKKTSPVPMAVEGVTVIPEPTRVVKMKKTAKAAKTTQAQVKNVAWVPPRMHPFPYSGSPYQPTDASCWPAIVKNLLTPNALMLLNRVWWETPGTSQYDFPFDSGYDRDDILNENIHADLFIAINRYAITFEGQPILREAFPSYFSGLPAESVQRFYLILYIRKEDIDEVFRAFKDDASVYFSAVNSKRLLKNRAFEQLAREKGPDHRVWFTMENEVDGGKVYITTHTGARIRAFENHDARPPGYDPGEPEWFIYGEEFYSTTIVSVGHPPSTFWTGPTEESHDSLRYLPEGGAVFDREYRDRKNREQPKNTVRVPTPFADTSIDHGRAILEKLLGALVASNRK